MNFLENFRKYPSSVNQIKFNIFSPTYRTKEIKGEKVIFENEFFKAKSSGYLLNQIHKDILDIILYEGDSSLEKMVKEETRAARLFNLYQIQKKLYQNKELKKYTKNDWLKEKIKELMRTTIDIEIKLDNKKEIWIGFHIIETAKSIVYDNNPQNKKFFVILSQEFLEFLKSDILINYGNYLDDILKLKTGQAKALARYAISFKNDFSESLESIMEKIGIGRNKFKNRKTFNEHRNRILSDLEGLRKLNIEIIETTKSNHIVKYKKLKDIYFYYNNKEKRVFSTLPAPNKLLFP